MGIWLQLSFGWLSCGLQESVNVDLALCGYIHAAVGDSRNGEAERFACTIARGILRGVVQFVRYIGGIVGEKYGRSIRAIPNLCGQDPHDAVLAPIRGNGG